MPDKTKAAEIKNQLRALKLKAKEKGADASSRTQFSQLKQRLRDEKAKIKFGSMDKATGKVKAMTSAALQKEMVKLQKRVQALVKAVNQAKPA